MWTDEENTIGKQRAKLDAWPNVYLRALTQRAVIIQLRRSQ